MSAAAESAIPYGYCQCGCGERTAIALKTRSTLGHVKGEPVRFVTGHNSNPRATFEDRFWQRVKQGPPDDCWPWSGARQGAGYGTLTVLGRKVLAHRLAYEMRVGPLGDGLYVCHHCDNPPCCNPRHLFAGTAADNARDMVAKGRQRHNPLTGDAWRAVARRLPRGLANPRGKLSDHDVGRVRALYRSGESPSVIAATFGISRNHVWRIGTGRERA